QTQLTRGTVSRHFFFFEEICPHHQQQMSSRERTAILRQGSPAEMVLMTTTGGLTADWALDYSSTCSGGGPEVAQLQQQAQGSSAGDVRYGQVRETETGGLEMLCKATQQLGGAGPLPPLV
ncbi:unnamed protein product, partial [Pylaiella littoralis]